jgi:hypothetical protein
MALSSGFDRINATFVEVEMLSGFALFPSDFQSIDVIQLSTY